MIFGFLFLSQLLALGLGCPYAKLLNADISAADLSQIHRSLQSSALGAPVCSIAPLNRGADFCGVYRDVTSSWNSLPLTSRQLLYGPLIRLAFHDAGEADITAPEPLGPDGCLNTANSDNAGLIESNQEVATTVEFMWQKLCDRISRADFWALLAKIAVQVVNLASYYLSLTLLFPL